MDLGLLSKGRTKRKTASQPVNNSRADSIRTRRKAGVPKKPSQKSFSTQTMNSAMPPVMVRGGAYGIPLVKRAPIHPRHKFSFPLQKLGKVILFPAIPDIRPGWRILSGFLTMSFAIMIIIAFATPEFGINQVEVYGLQRLSVSDMETTLKLTDLRVFTASPVVIKAQVEEAYPGLKEVSVKVGLPDKMIINVTERQPVVAWSFQDMMVWIDNEGVIFPAFGDSGSLINIYAGEPPPLLAIAPPQPVANVGEDPEELALVTPKDTRKLVDPILLKTALTLSSQVPQGTQLVYNNWNGLGWKDPGGWDVFVGRNLENLDQKLIVYQGIKGYLINKGIQPKIISVEHVHAPFYRVE